jgi:hypothetical protein
VEDRHYAYAAKDDSLNFGDRLGHVGEQGNENAKAAHPKVPYPLGKEHHWKVLADEIVVFAQDGEQRIAARIRPYTVYEITPNGITIVMENVQPGAKQFEQLAATPD